MQKPSKDLLPRFVLIESSIFTDNRITSTEKLLYSYICLLTNNKKLCCFATNKYFATIFNLKPRQIQNCLSNLKKYNYIIIRNENNKRFINTTLNHFLDKREMINETIEDIANFEEILSYNYLEENE